MREEPTCPSPLRGPSPGRTRPLAMEYSSTSTLLQEISTLRARLKDLEDDTKSSAVVGPNADGADSTFMLMRKDIARLQEEKANQEKEFLNQMTRQQKEVDELIVKLGEANNKESRLEEQIFMAQKEIDSLRETVKGHQICESEVQFSIILSNLKETHAKEMEQMKENILSADREISESRGEIDALQEELDEMQNHRQALLDEVTSARLYLDQEQERANKLHSELANVQAKLEKKTKENMELVSVIEVLQTQNRTIPNEVTTSLTTPKVNTLQAISTDSEESPISPTEHSRLIRDMQELEDRLVKFHTKLAEKDSKIDELTRMLARERGLKKSQLCCENKDANPPVAAGAVPQALRPVVASSPRTRCKAPAVAGIVASFERRLINGVSHDIEEEIESPASVSFDTVFENSDVILLQRKLKLEKELVSNLKASLTTEKEKVTKLTEELWVERNTVADLRSRVESDTTLRIQMKQQIEKLCQELNETKNAQHTSISLAAKERSELSRLRSEAVYAKVIRDDLESKLQSDNQELERLRVQLSSFQYHGTFQEEKKEYEDDEVTALQSLVTKKEKTLERLSKQYKLYEASTEETISRLRNQVEALQSELEKAMLKIESLDEQLSNAHENKIKVEKIELDLTMEKARQAEMLSKYETTTQKMEKTIYELETRNKELAVSIDSNRQYEEECSRLRQQLSNAQDQLETIENDHKEKVRGLENRASELLKTLEMERNNTAKDSSRQNDEVSQLSVEIRRIQKEKEALECQHADDLANHKKEIETLEKETESQLEAKQDVIDKLTEALALKEKRRSGLSSGVDVSFSRRDEFKEINDELLDVIAQNKAYAREIQNLKKTVRGFEEQKESALVNQQRRIEELEDEIIALNSEMRQQTDRESVSKLKSEISHLREFVRELKTERRQLRDRCDSGIEKGVSKSSQMLREKNAKLKQEVEKLTRRLRKLEDSITRVAV